MLTVIYDDQGHMTEAWGTLAPCGAQGGHNMPLCYKLVRNNLVAPGTYTDTAPGDFITHGIWELRCKVFRGTLEEMLAQVTKAQSDFSDLLDKAVLTEALVKVLCKPKSGKE